MSYAEAKARYAAIGVDTEAAIARLKTVPISLHCWQGDDVRGFDTDPTMLRISAMNLMLHSISHPDISYQDSVSKQNQISERYTLCLANPPFKGTVDAESINDDLKAVTNTKKTELLFLALFLRMLKKGGQCACIVPDGVLFLSLIHISEPTRP